jgi:hypothetical protein
MGTAPEVCNTEEQFLFLWTKGLNATDIQKEMFPVYDEKCSLHKAVHILVENFSEGRSKVADDETEVRN